MNRVLTVDDSCIRNACILCFVCNFDKRTVASYVCFLLIFGSFVSVFVVFSPCGQEVEGKGNWNLSTIKTLLCKIWGSWLMLIFKKLFCIYLRVCINNEGIFLLINFCKVILIWSIICWRGEGRKNICTFDALLTLDYLYNPWLNQVRWYLKSKTERNKLYVWRRINLIFPHLISILYINTSITGYGGLILAKGQNPTSCPLTSPPQQNRGENQMKKLVGQGKYIQTVLPVTITDERDLTWGKSD